MPRVIFEFNAKKEYDYINFFEENFGEINLPKNIRKAWGDKKKAVALISKSYDKKKKENYEKRWGKMEKEYFELVEEITGHKWNHGTYKVIVTKYMLGFCNPFDSDTKEVIVRQDFDKIESNYIIAHELFHSHYHKIASLKNKSKLFNTELNENCVILSLCFTGIRKLLVEKKNEWIIDGWISSHPGAAKYFKKLLSAWESRKNFDDYLNKSLVILKNNNQ